jgi:hypothetical protein
LADSVGKACPVTYKSAHLSEITAIVHCRNAVTRSERDDLFALTDVERISSNKERASMPFGETFKRRLDPNAIARVQYGDAQSDCASGLLNLQ